MLEDFDRVFKYIFIFSLTLNNLTGAIVMATKTEEYLLGEIKDENFLAQELLIPGASCIDGMRTLMFSKHSNQVSTPVNPEVPRVFTGYENFIGKHSYGIQKVTGTVLFVNKLFIVYSDELNILRTIYKDPISKTIENYGLKLKYDEDLVRNQKLDDHLVKTCSHFDESGVDFGYGVNLLTAPFSYKGFTFEDGIGVRKSVAEKILRYDLVKKEMISANSNDVFLNIRGKGKSYEPFYKIGETVDKILAIRRKADYSNLSMLLPEALKEPNPNDLIISAKGLVLDINVYCNDPDELALRPAYSYINEVYLEKKELYSKFADRITELLKTKHKQSNELIYVPSHETQFYLKKALNYVNGTWTNSGSSFDFLNIEYVISEEKHVEVGSKLTDRMAGKGVSAIIIPDEDMPVTEDGRILDVVTNPIAPENRLIAAKRYELEVTYIINQVIKALNNAFNFTSETAINFSDADRYHDFFKELMQDIMNDKDYNFYLSQIKQVKDSFSEEEYKWFIIQLVSEISVENYSIQIRPFLNRLSFKWLESLYDKYEVKPSKIFFHPKDPKPMAQPMIYGYSYWVILRHQPVGKASARSLGYYSRLGVPAKTISEKSSNPLEIGSTPVRMGEQERFYLYLLNNPDLVRYLMDTDFRKMYEVALRNGMIKTVPALNSNENRVQLEGFTKAIGITFEDTRLVKCSILEQ
jgi:DNA-directed RNA polymerase beta subunit